MIKEIKQVRIEPHTQEWLDYRYAKGFGGSDIASVVATRSKTIAELTYTPPIKFFLQMIGEPVQSFTGNVASESGHYFEPIIMDWLKYWDIDHPDQLEMFRRITRNEKLNKVIRPKVYMENTKYPWLFYSPDAFCWPGKDMGTVKALGESKNTTSMEARRYVNKVSPSFFCQVQQGLLITELPVAYLCILIDGRWLEVVPIEPHKETQEIIIEASKDFWARIQKAREIKKKAGLVAYFGVNPETLNSEQKEAAELISSLEPDMIGTDAELSFIKEMCKPSEEDNPMAGTDEQRAWCEEYNRVGEAADAVDVRKKTLQIKLIESLKGSNKAVFGDDDKVYYSYKEDARGSRRLYVSPKIVNSELKK